MLRNRNKLATFFVIAVAIGASTCSQAQITYRDAVEGLTGNTFATGGSLGDTSWVGIDSVNANNSQWSKRSSGFSHTNGGSIYQALGASGNSIPELTSQITGLADGAYTVWAFYWDQVTDNQQNWVLSAGLTSGSLTTYSSPDEPAVAGATTTGVTDANSLTFTSPVSTIASGLGAAMNQEQRLFGVNLGQVVVSGGSPINVFVDNNIVISSGNRSVYDGVGYELLDTITLEVNTDSGSLRLVNNSSIAFDLTSYEILSASGSLNPAGWSSLDAQDIDAIDGDDPGAIAGDSIGEGWDVAVNSSNLVLSEVRLSGGSSLAPGESLHLGAGFRADMMQDLAFNFTLLGGAQLATGVVSYVTGLGGDYNGDGAVDAADYTVWRDTLGGAGPGLAADGNGDMVVDGLDYQVWRGSFGLPQPAAGNLASAAVPEPTSAWLLAPIVALAWRRCVG